MDISMVIGEIMEEVVVDKYLKFTDYPSRNILSILQALSPLILKTTLWDRCSLLLHFVDIPYYLEMWVKFQMTGIKEVTQIFWFPSI